jgi:hypothetical protein
VFAKIKANHIGRTTNRRVTDQPSACERHGDRARRRMIFLDSPSMRRHLVVRSSFNAQWTVKPKQSIFAQLGDPPDSGTRVTLPHDAMLTFVRSPNESDGPQSGYFPGGAVEYAKAF